MGEAKALYAALSPADLLCAIQQASNSEAVGLTPVYGNFFKMTTDYRVVFPWSTPFTWDERARVMNRVKEEFRDHAIIRITSERIINQRLTWTIHVTRCEGMSALIEAGLSI